MRTLVLAPEPPVPARSGLPLRIQHLARQLAGARPVELVALSGDPAPPADQPFALRHFPQDWSQRNARPWPWGEPSPVAQAHSPALAEFVRGGAWTTVQAHTLEMVPFGQATGAPLVFDAPDAVSDVAGGLRKVDSRPGAAAAWRSEQRNTRRAERRTVREVTAVTVPTDEEAALFERWRARTVVVVRNGVDVGGIAHRLPAAGARIVLVAYLRWRPNVEAALELVDRVLPRVRSRIPDATVCLVGKDPPPEVLRHQGATVEVTGGVDDVLPYLHSARVTVLPLRAGGGTRLKALEALAAGVPMVATPLAVNGLGLRDGEHVLIGRSPADLAEQAIRVVRDDALARRLSLAGRRLVEERYDWSVVARPLLALHDELGERAGRSVRRV
jgi:glycosyltransferase involved in cell wall biosynthesis